jgi:hypothetical protein
VPTTAPPPPPPEVVEPAIGSDLADELLLSFSFDDLPTTVPRANRRSGSDDGGERR